MNVPEMPFKILSLAPFNLVPEGNYKPRIVVLEDNDLDKAIKDLGVSLYIQVPKTLLPSGSLSLQLERMKDFHPDGLIKSNPILGSLAEARDYITNAVNKGEPAVSIYNHLKSLPDLPLEIHYSPQTETSGPKKKALSEIDDIMDMVSDPVQEPVGSSSEPESWASQIDRILREALGYIFADETFRQYEASWRGAEILVRQGIGKSDTKVLFAPISMDKLDESLEPLTVELALNLPSVIIVDLPFNSSTKSFEMMEKLAEFGERLLVPVIACIDEGFFHLNNWSEMDKLPYLPNFLDEPAFAKFKRLKGLSAGNWLTLTCNSFLARFPYGQENKPRTVDFEEGKPLWINPVWGLACLLAKSVKETGWPTSFTDWHTNKLEGLGLHSPDDGQKLPTEVSITTERIAQFKEAGIMPLVGQLKKDIAFTPVEITVAESSLSFQLLLSRVIGFLLELRDNNSGDVESDSLRAAFKKFWEKTGHNVPDDLDISVEATQPDQPPTVSIKLTPPREVLPSKQKLELSIGW